MRLVGGVSAVVSLGDAVEEAGADDAAATPDLGDLAKLKIPSLVNTDLGDEVESLGVGDNLGSVERVAHFLHKLFLTHLKIEVPVTWSLKDSGSNLTLVAHGGKNSRFDRTGDG